MRLREAIKASNIEVAEWYGPITVVVGIDGGEQLEVSFKRGELPPYKTETYDADFQVDEMLLVSFRELYEDDKWEPIIEEAS